MKTTDEREHHEWKKKKRDEQERVLDEIEEDEFESIGYRHGVYDQRKRKPTPSGQ